MASAICFNLDQLKILSSGNELKIVLLFTRGLEPCKLVDDMQGLNLEGVGSLNP